MNSPPNHSPELELRSLSVAYPTFDLEPLSLDFAAGERVALVGPNGAGKTTVLNAVSGRLRAYKGRVLVRGTDARTLLPGLRNNVGVMPDNLLGFGWLTVRRHFDFLGQMYDRWDTEYEAQLVDRLEISLDGRLGTLSRGNRAKVAFVSAEAYRPRILLLDEPTSGLDPIVRRSLIETVVDTFGEDSGRLVLFSTHILEDVQWLAERVLVLREGRLVCDSPVADLCGDGTSLSAALYALLDRARTGNASE